MEPSRMNALWNCKNPYQGKNKKILAVCSAGLLRSPTIAWYLTRNTTANCRSAGINDYALIPVDDILINWADIIICADESHYDNIKSKYDITQPIYNFNIPDIFAYCDPKLLELIEEQVIRQGIFNDK